MLQTELKDKIIMEHVRDILIGVGMKCNSKGYYYTTRACVEAVNNPMIVGLFTKDLYPSIAKEFDSTSSRVERCIRTSISGVNYSTPVGKEVFGCVTHLTNSQFITAIGDYIRLNF